MNFAIIGYGAIGDVHAKAIETMSNGKLVALATRNPQKGAEAHKKYGCDIYTDHKEMLKRNDIDIVSICLPSGMHYEAAMDVAEAGKHCIVEKPIEISVERSEKMIETFQKKNLKFSVIFQHRFDSSTRLLKKAIERGELGRLNYGKAQTRWFRDDKYYSDSDWRGTWKGDGGGALINQAIHSIDLMLHFMGPIESVCGKCDTLYHSSIKTEDIGLAIVRFKSGALGTIEGTTLAKPGFHSGVHIYGQNGAAIIKNDQLEFAGFETGLSKEIEELMNNGDENIPYGWYNLAPHIRQFQDVCDAIKYDRNPLVDGEAGLQSLKVIKTIYESSKANRWLDIK